MITDNIKALCKINDKPIGELEQELGHSKGYLTQIKDRIRWNEILYICKIFDVSIIDLQENDYTKVRELLRLIEVGASCFIHRRINII